jgi:RNA polymerase sigma-70 factor, ECF subfamily
MESVQRMPEPEDPSRRLVELIQAGENVTENFQRLFDLHYAKVVSFFERKRFSHEESRDLTQDVFFRVFKGIAAFRREASFRSWLFEIATNVFRNEVRRRKAEKRDAPEQPLLTEPDPDSDLPSGGAVVPSPEPGALEGLVRQERLKNLRKALQELPDQMRRCCILRYEKGLKYEEIATVMKISVQTVKAHLHQAKKKLTEKLGPLGRGGSTA